MKITIAIPAYNQAQYLPEAIDSALSQTYENTEIIIVNDGSPDETGEIAQKYQLAHPFKIKVIHQVNKGLASARNTAIMNMTGEYLLPLDSDDMLLDVAVSTIVETIKKTNADIVAPSFKTFGLAHEDVILMESPTIGDFRTFNRIGYFSAIRKTALLECGGYSPRMQEGWEDYHLWFDLLTRGKTLVTIPTPLVLYRTKENSMWHDSVKASQKLWNQMFKDFPDILPAEIVTS